MSTILKALERVQDGRPDDDGVHQLGAPSSHRPEEPYREPRSRLLWVGAALALVGIGLVVGAALGEWRGRSDGPSGQAAVTVAEAAPAPADPSPPSAVARPPAGSPRPPLGASGGGSTGDGPVAPPPAARRPLVPVPSETPLPVVDVARSSPPKGAPGARTSTPLLPIVENQRAPSPPPVAPRRAEPEPPPAVEKPVAPAPTPVAEKPPPPAPVAKKPAPKPAAAPVAKKPAPKPAPAPVARKTAPKPAPAPVAKKPAPKPAAPAVVARRSDPVPAAIATEAAEVAVVRAAPEIHIESTVWHPSSQRRSARVRIAGRDEPVELREGDAVGRVVVGEIQPSGVVFLQGGSEFRRAVGE